MNPKGLAEGKPNMIENYISTVFSFAELASSLVIVVNHVGFIVNMFLKGYDLKLGIIC